MSISSPGFEHRAAVALGDQIDGLGRAAHEHDLVARAGVDEGHQPVARPLVERGRLLAQRMHAAVDVGVMVALVVVDGVDHGQRPLGGGAAVQVGQAACRAPCGQHGN